MDDYTITAPISGTIISKDVKVGDTVGTSTATADTMCVIYDMSYLEMTLNVDELDILNIKEGQKATITADAVSGQTFEGVVTSISKAGTTTGGTTTYPVTIRIDETGRACMPGMNATAVIVHRQRRQTPSPCPAMRPSPAATTCWSPRIRPAAANADASMNAPDGYVYVKVDDRRQRRRLHCHHQRPDRGRRHHRLRFQLRHYQALASDDAQLVMAGRQIWPAAPAVLLAVATEHREVATDERTH